VVDIWSFDKNMEKPIRARFFVPLPSRLSDLCPRPVIHQRYGSLNLIFTLSCYYFFEKRDH